MLVRLLRLSISAAGALALALLLNGMMAGPAAGQAATETGAAPASAGPALAAGDSLTVTVQLVTTGTCRFAIYDVTLRGAEPQFRFVDPSSNVIGPPGKNPAAWRLAAVQTGVATFTVSFHGETYCDGAWQWTLVESEPQVVTVAPALAALPYMSRNTPPIPIADLGTLGGGHSLAQAINNRGEVAGFSRTAAGETHAFLWRNGVMTDLGSLGGTTSVAIAINERGQGVGHSWLGPIPPNHGFVWANGVMTDIGAPDGQSSMAVDINLAGQVLVHNQVDYNASRGQVWADGVVTDLITLGGASTIALDINDRGQVAGYSMTAAGGQHAFLWQNGPMLDLNPPGASSSTAPSAACSGSMETASHSARFLAPA